MSAEGQLPRGHRLARPRLKRRALRPGVLWRWRRQSERRTPVTCHRTCREGRAPSLFSSGGHHAGDSYALLAPGVRTLVSRSLLRRAPGGPPAVCVRGVCVCVHTRVCVRGVGLDQEARPHRPVHNTSPQGAPLGACSEGLMAFSLSWCVPSTLEWKDPLARCLHSSKERFCVLFLGFRGCHWATAAGPERPPVSAVAGCRGLSHRRLCLQLLSKTVGAEG